MSPPPGLGAGLKRLPEGVNGEEKLPGELLTDGQATEVKDVAKGKLRETR